MSQKNKNTDTDKELNEKENETSMLGENDITENNTDAEGATSNQEAKADEKPDIFKESNLELQGLSKKERFNKKKDIEKSKLKEMNFSQKTVYILSYYKWYFIVAATVLVLIISVVEVLYNNSKPTALNCFIINNEDTYYIEENLIKGFRDYYDLDLKTNVYVEADLKINKDEDATLTQYNITDYEKIIMYIENSQLDAMICDSEALEYYASTGELYSIDQVLDKETYKDIYDFIGDDIASSKDSLGNEYECAIDISNTKLAKDLDISYSPAYICIPGHPKNIEGSANLIRYFYNIEPKNTNE